MTDYSQKYNKYKNKYNKLNLKGGKPETQKMELNKDSTDPTLQAKNIFFSLEKIKTLTIDDTIKDEISSMVTESNENKHYDINVESYNYRNNLLIVPNLNLVIFNHKSTLDQEKHKEKILFIIPGMSLESSLKTLNEIYKKKDELFKNFKQIYFFEHSSFKFLQEYSCSVRDQIINNTNLSNLDFEDKKLHISSKLNTNAFIPELTANKEIAKAIILLIKSKSLENVHVLGKCNGCWVSNLLLFEGDQQFVKNIKGLYLTVPGIPYGLTLPKCHDLKHINFKLYFRRDDGFKFKWGKSHDEHKKYEKQLNELIESKIINYNNPDTIIHNFQKDTQIPLKIEVKTNHEILPIMIDDLISLLSLH